MHAEYPLFPMRRAQRGQTLIIAIAILFVLLFIGGIFVAQVGRNLTTSGRSRQIQQATQLAEAGIQYCNEQLNSSEEGADWRPEPSPLIAPANVDPNGLRDPDYIWIVKGFHRLSMKGGRALVRVVYDPNPSDPRGSYLKIESVGRPGELDPEDPTEFVPAGTSSRLRKEMVAYKQIGLTDFLRFVTNRTKNTTEAVFGVPTFGVPLVMVLGEPEVGNSTGGRLGDNLLFGAPIHVNANLKLVGDTRLYLSKRGQAANLATERIEATGVIVVEPTRDVDNDGNIDPERDLQSFINQKIDANPDANPNTSNNAIRQTGQNFSTLGGIVHDGTAGTDSLGYNRNAMTLGAPLLSATVGGGSVSRYLAMTANSGRIGRDANNNVYNTGQSGYGDRGIYINNPEDRQEESSDVPNSLSLRSEWLKGSGQHWQGPFYHPPGVTVELLGNRIRLTRTTGQFNLPDGTSITQQGGNVLDIPLSDYERLNYVLPNGAAFPLKPFPHDGDESESNPNNPAGYKQSFGDKKSYGVNVVIYAEGNLRVKGRFGDLTDSAQAAESATISKLGRVHVTIVSGGTVYIDGNIVKSDGFVSSNTTELERGSTCALMARDYVCVNTPSFMSPVNEGHVWSRYSPDTDLFYDEIGTTGQSADFASSFGIDPANYNTPTFLFLRHAAISGDSVLMNLLVNPAFAPNPTDPLFLFNDPGLGASGFAHVRALGIRFDGTSFVNDPHSSLPQFEQRAYPLFATAQTNAYRLSRLPGLENLFRFQIDQTSAAAIMNAYPNISVGGSGNYALGGAFIAPLDIRIEAMVYAQDRSFFIIPGNPMNPEPNDNRSNAATRDERKGSIGDTAQDTEMKRTYPFYNEPADIRITIEGAVSENYTASLADQTQWLNRWGWVPGNFGSSTQQVPNIHLTVHDPASINPAQVGNADYRTPQEVSANITRGMRFLYDPSLAMPYYRPRDAGAVGDNTTVRDLRQRRALRAKVVQVGATNQRNSGTMVRQILPPMPRLPVCPDLLFMGDSERRFELD